MSPATFRMSNRLFFQVSTEIQVSAQSLLNGHKNGYLLSILVLRILLIFTKRLARNSYKRFVFIRVSSHVDQLFVPHQYDSRIVGAYGSGGEYVVQEGYGWTNGGVLRLLELFPKRLIAPEIAYEGPTPELNKEV